MNSTHSGNSGSGGSGGTHGGSTGGPGQGGDLFAQVGAPQTAHTILASGTPDQCAFAPGTGLTDAGGKLEDGSTCGFSSANHSLANTNPQLGSLADNGGPT